MNLDDLVAEMNSDDFEDNRTQSPNDFKSDGSERKLSEVSIGSYVSISECESLCHKSNTIPHYIVKTIKKYEDMDVVSEKGLKRHREFHGARKGPRLSSGQIYGNNGKNFVISNFIFLRHWELFK